MERKQPSFRKDDRGAIAMVLGLAMPVLLIGVAAGMEYGQLAARRTQLQRAADSAALAAARELTLANADDARVGSVARNAALTALSSGKPEGTTATAQGVVIDKRSGVQVTVTETVSSLMGKVLSLPASELSAKATANYQVAGGSACSRLTSSPLTQSISTRTPG